MAYLQGCRVVDLTDHRGALAGRLLADLGADVILIEPPGGSRERYASVEAPADASYEELLWTILSYNKRSVACDLDAVEGRAILERLCNAADIVLVTGSPSELRARGLSYGELGRSNAGLIHVTMSPYGLEGVHAEFADSDLTIWAASGALARNRVFGRQPIRIGAANQGYYHGAADAVTGALLALSERARSGLGQQVDISFQQSLVIASLYQGLFPLVNDVSASPQDTVSVFPTIWRTKSGHVQFNLASGPANGHFTNKFIDWVCERGMMPEAFPQIDWREMPQTSGSGLSNSGATKERFGEKGLGDRERQWLVEIIEEFFLECDTEQLLEAALTRRLLLSPILSMAEISDNDHYRARNVFRLTGDPLHPEQLILGDFAVTSPNAFVNHGMIGEAGSATTAILNSWLNISEEEAQQFARGAPIAN